MVKALCKTNYVKYFYSYRWDISFVRSSPNH